MGTKNISLPSELEAYIDAKVASGAYSHASEVVRDALRGMMRVEAEKFEWLRNAITDGIKSANEGPMLTAQESLADIEKRGRAILAARQSKA